MSRGATTLDLPVESTVTQSAPPAATPSTDPEAPCGPDRASAVRQALSRLDPEPVTGAAWDPTPQEGNFHACAHLSTVLITVVGGTGSSPMQALMFHRGEFLGRGRRRRTRSRRWTPAHDTVALRYRSGQSCTACSNGLLTTVRYQWDGNSVQMLDPSPPGG